MQGKWSRGAQWFVICAMAAVLLDLGYWAMATWRYQHEMDLSNDPKLSSPALLAALRKAAGARPDLSLPWREQAGILQFSHPHQALLDAHRALRLNALNWRNWHRLGMLHYQLGRLHKAAYDLHQADRYNRGFLSHFQSANLAFLLGNQPDFLRDMRLALAMVPPAQSAFTVNQFWHLSGGNLPQLLHLLPPRAAVQAAAVTLLRRQHHLRDAGRIWRHMHCPSYQPRVCRNTAMSLVQAWQNRLWSPAPVAAGGMAVPVAAKSHTPAAAPAQSISRSMSVWNQAVRRGYLHAARARRGHVTDGRLQFPWLGGWTWTAPNPALLVPLATSSGTAITASFSGNQASHVLLLWQWLALDPGVCYRLSYQSRGSLLTHGRGIAVTAWDHRQTQVAAVPARLTRDWRSNVGYFRVASSQAMLQLRVGYDRPYGHQLLQGQIWIRNLHLRPASPASLAVSCRQPPASRHLWN